MNLKKNCYNRPSSCQIAIAQTDGLLVTSRGRFVVVPQILTLINKVVVDGLCQLAAYSQQCSYAVRLGFVARLLPNKVHAGSKRDKLYS